VRSRGEVVCVVGALSGSCIYLVIYDAAGPVQSRDYGEQAAMKMEEFKQGRRESSRGQIQEIWPQAAVGRNLLYASHHLRVHSAVSIMHGGDLHVKTLPLLSPRSADAACNKPEKLYRTGRGLRGDIDCFTTRSCSAGRMKTTMVMPWLFPSAARPQWM
jgi:hypothetical protein